MNRRFLTFLAPILALLLAGCATPDSTSATSPAGAPAVDYRNSRAEVVVLSFFDMYCPHCQTAAAHVNKVHAMVQARGLGSRVAFFAIGWGNSEMESEIYRKRFSIPFPVVPDRNKAISSRFGKFRPPLLVALRKQGGSWTEFYRISDVRGKQDEIFAGIQP